MKTIRSAFYLLILLFVAACGDQSNQENTASNAKFSEVQFPATAAEIQIRTDTTIANLSTGLQVILEADPRTFENTIVAYDRLAYKGYSTYGLFNLLSQNSPKAEVRDAASAGNLQLAGWFFQVMSNSALHDVLAEFIGKQDDYSGEQKYLLERILTVFEGYGLGQEQVTRDAIQQLNLHSEQLKQTIYALLANGDPQGETPELLATLVKSSTAWANLLGWESYGAYIIDHQMAKTPEAAKSFIEDVSSQLDQPFKTLLAELRAIKATETQDASAEIYYDDIVNYLDKGIAQNYQIADFTNRYFNEGIFALEDVFATLFDIAGTVFDIDIVAADSPVTVWSEDVHYYQATDSTTDETLGSFYLDLYQREGKLGGGRLSKVIVADTQQNGERLRPVDAIIMNFPQPEEGSSVLLSFNETRGIFHEFGHLLKELCSGNRYYFSSSLSGSQPDFMEINSNLLEQWMTDPNVIESLLGSNPAMTPEEIDLWTQARNDFFLDKEKFQVFLSMFGLNLYTNYSTYDDIDPLAIQEATLREYYHPLTTGHVLNQINGISQQVNYSGTYYSYVWAKVIAYDIVSRFSKSDKGLMDPVLGRKLRQNIFTVNYDFEPDKSLQSFLDRPWDTNAYYEYFGIQ